MESTLTHYLLQYAPSLAVAAVASFATWIRLIDRAKSLEKRIDTVETRLNAVDNVQNEINVKLASIETNILWIKERLK